MSEDFEQKNRFWQVLLPSLQIYYNFKFLKKYKGLKIFFELFEQKWTTYYSTQVLVHKLRPFIYDEESQNTSYSDYRCCASCK